MKLRILRYVYFNSFPHSAIPIFLNGKLLILLAWKTGPRSEEFAFQERSKVTIGLKERYLIISPRLFSSPCTAIWFLQVNFRRVDTWEVLKARINNSVMWILFFFLILSTDFSRWIIIRCIQLTLGGFLCTFFCS